MHFINYLKNHQMISFKTEKFEPMYDFFNTFCEFFVANFQFLFEIKIEQFYCSLPQQTDKKAFSRQNPKITIICKENSFTILPFTIFLFPKQNTLLCSQILLFTRERIFWYFYHVWWTFNCFILNILFWENLIGNCAEFSILNFDFYVTTSQLYIINWENLQSHSTGNVLFSTILRNCLY